MSADTASDSTVASKAVGSTVGLTAGSAVGSIVGYTVGYTVGSIVGSTVGSTVGFGEGVGEGTDSAAIILPVRGNMIPMIIISCMPLRCFSHQSASAAALLPISTVSMLVVFLTAHSAFLLHASSYFIHFIQPSINNSYIITLK